MLKKPFLATVKRFLKALVVKLPPCRFMSCYLTRDIPRIFMYHRFIDDGITKGVTRDNFEWQIEMMMNNFHVVKLSEYIETAKNGNPPKASVIITIDDAYYDFYSTAYPLLAKNRLPATLFIATDFVDGRDWFWWDELKYALEQTDKADITFIYKGKKFQITTSSADDKLTGWHILADYCMNLLEGERNDFIAAIAYALNVKIPAGSVDEYRQMTWDEIAEVFENGIELGAHSLSHAILTRIDDGRLEKEIAMSKKVIEEKTGQPVKIFCYPNGMPADYNESVIEAVKKAGYKAAVVAHDGHYDTSYHYTIPRMSVSNDRVEFLWKLYGMHYLAMKASRYIKYIWQALPIFIVMISWKSEAI